MSAVKVVTVALIMVAGPGIAAAAGGGDGLALDPVVGDVVRMLEQGVSPEVISRWLAASGRRPGLLGADDVIALSAAGATDRLMAHLLDLSSVPEDAPGAGHAPELPAAGPGGEAAVAGPVEVGFSIAYHPEVMSELGEEWSLFVYVDGRPLAWSEGGLWVYDGSSTDLRATLAPGRHVVRVALERHRLRSRRRHEWSHQARFCPEPVILDLEPGHDWRVRLVVGSAGVPTVGGGGALGWSVVRDGESIAGEERAAGLPGVWPSLCEDALTAFEEDELASRRAARALLGCVTWGDLWQGVDGVPGRGAVRSELETYGFRPSAAPGP